MDRAPKPSEATLDLSPAAVIARTAGSEVTLSCGQSPSEQDVSFSVTEATQEALSLDRPIVAGYEIIGVLGRGGMGVVYKAQQTSLNRVVALKMVLAGLHADPSHLARFLAEAKAEARLQHPNIVQVYDVGIHNGLPFFSMEYVPGGSLSQRIAGKPQPAPEAAHCVEILARAMHFAHQRGVVHRDLKPANILLHKDEVAPGKSMAAARIAQPAAFTPKISDFGLAKQVEDNSSQTRTGTVMGTPSYMAPEQARGNQREIGPASDQYALGAILYELLTGRPPFQAPTVLETLDQVRSQEVVPPRQLQPRLSADLETICLKCLQKEPAKRFATCEELAEDLRRFQAGEPIRARPISNPERLWRWCRRNPRSACLSAAVLALLVLVAITSTVFSLIVAQKQRETEQARLAAEAARLLADRRAEEAIAESQRADRNARVAASRYDMAVDALNLVLNKVQVQLEEAGLGRKLRQDILESVLALLQKSVSREATGLPERGLASAHVRIADILWDQGKRAEAVKHCDIAHEMLLALHEANPERDKDAGNFAFSLAKQGDMNYLFRSNPQAAKNRYLEALKIQEELLAHPRSRELTPIEIKQTIAGSYNRLGEICLKMGPDSVREAEDYLQKSLALREELARTDSGSGVRQALASTHQLLGDASSRLDKRTAALRHYDTCLDLRKQLVRDNPSNPQFRTDLLNLCGTLGDFYLFSGETKLAKNYYQAALAPTEQLAAADRRPGIQNLLAQNYYRMATACLRLCEQQLADQYYGKCLPIREKFSRDHPQDPNSIINLMIIRARCGQHEQAASLAQKLQTDHPRDKGFLLQVSCGYALCAGAVTHGKPDLELSPDIRKLLMNYSARAVDALRRAVDQGYNDVHNLELEPDLDPVRGDKGFLLLMGQLRGSKGK